MVETSNTCISSKEAWRLFNTEPSLIDLQHYLAKSPFQRPSKIVSFSKNITIPVTRICRNRCGYCSFVEDPGRVSEQLLSSEQVRELLQAGAELHCKEALFMMGERPEDRAPEITDLLASWGYHGMVDYLVHLCKMALEYGLLPHTNAGVLDGYELGCLRQVNASMGLMLESSSEHLCRRGGPHELSPGKRPGVRLQYIEEAGRLRIPFTTGIMVGIGEEPKERIDALLLLRDMHRRYGHIQEIIIQKFYPKAGTPMSMARVPQEEELLKTVIFTRLIFGAEMNIQAPYNLISTSPLFFIRAGANDWGGISPFKPDAINPEKEWPHLDDVRKETRKAGCVLKERLAVYPEFINDEFLYTRIKGAVMSLGNYEGYIRENSDNG